MHDAEQDKGTSKGWRSAAAKPGSPPPREERPGEYDNTVHQIHARLVEKLDVGELAKVPEERRRDDLRGLVERMVEADAQAAALPDRTRLVEEVLDEVVGLGPLEKLLRDPSVSDILVNGAHEVFVDRRGALEPTDVRFRDEAHVMLILDRIVSKVGRRVDEQSPMVDARLADGSRVNAVIPPLSLRGVTISIRRFGTKALTVEDLIRFRALAPEMCAFLEAVVKARLNTVISGGTGSGKTTLLNALSRFIPATERIITIEDAAELQLQQRHVVQLETRPPNIEGKGAVTTRDMVRNTLRMRPDRIVVGECRGAEAFDMLQAMNTGHDGSLTTLHANTPRDTLTRLETMMLMAGFELPVKAMRQQIAGALNILVQSARLQGGVRRVTSITELIGMEGDTLITQDIFVYRQLGVRPDGKAFGQFVATGVRPHCSARMETANIHLPADMFAERVLLRDFE